MQDLQNTEDIPSYFIKQIGITITPFLVQLFNSSLHLNFIPSQWKTAYITPIFKKGDQTKPKNYRPISLTSGFSRLFEIIFHKKILEHFHTHDLFSSNQFGFLPQRSSCSQMIKSVHDWYNNFSQGRLTHVLYTDISKAFDSVCHRKLYNVLKSYGISLRLVEWLYNFLKDRQHQVAINDFLSSPCNILSGIPQGSILGPLMFLIYLNDIDSCSNSFRENTKISLFADDSKIYGNDFSELQSSLNDLGEWLKDRHLKLAPEKCFSLHIGKHNTSHQSFFFNETCISSSQAIKDLGIYVTHNLKWTTHINYIYKRAKSTSYHILKFTKTKNIWTLLKLYTTYVRPKIEHNTPIWSPSLTQDVKKLENIQKHFTRSIFNRCNIPFNSYSNRLYQLNIHSLQYRRIYFDLITIFKIIHGISGLEFDDFFVRRSQPYMLRGNEFKIDTINKYKSSTWQNSFFVRAVKLWNALPNDISSSPSLNIFKSKLNNYNLSSITNLIFS